jgi:4-hydroxy-tetrahydrodipicolinate synthase
MHELCAAALAGDREAALRIDHRLAPLHKAMFLESNPIPVKWAVQQLNLIPGGIRLPLTPLSAGFHDQVRQAMEHASII